MAPPKSRRYISVGVRVRAFNECEKALEGQSVVSVTTPSTLVLGAPADDGTKEVFPLNFVMNSAFPPPSSDSSLGPYVDQAHLMPVLGNDALRHMLQGDDVLLAAYGAPASGKHNTMLGSWRSTETRRGLLPQIASALFKDIDEQKKALAAKPAAAQWHWKFRVAVRAFEVHNEKLNDLLVPPERWPAAGHELTPLADGSGYFSKELMWQTVVNIDELHEVVTMAQENATQKVQVKGGSEEYTPRSHVMFQLMYEKLYNESEDGSSSPDVVEKEAAITFAYLGGHDQRLVKEDEKVDDAGLMASLGAFAKCLHMAVDGAPAAAIPYKSTMLTKVLQHCIEKAFVTVIGHISPSSTEMEKTRKTLEFLAKLTATVDAKVMASSGEVVVTAPPAAASASASAGADSSAGSSAADRQLIEKLLARIQSLEAGMYNLTLRVKELEKK